MEQISFKIRFITPLLIHGASSREADGIGLTGKALRGCWRFWFRAIVGGIVKNISKEELLELESSVFGSSDENIGAKFRILIEEEVTTRQKDRFYLGFKYKKGKKAGQRAASHGYEEGLVNKIKILPRTKTFPEKDILLSSIWLWGNLGGIGQRARRGFGSPMIESGDNKKSFKIIIESMNKELTFTSQFSESENLREHLRNGLNIVWQTFSQWFNNKGQKISGDITINNIPTYQNYFIINSLKQILVGNKPYGYEIAIKNAHGSNQCESLGWARGNSRMASPIYTRFFEINDGLLPVITWCKQNVNNHEVPEKDCFIKYLKGGKCSTHNAQFAGLDCTTNLKGDPISGR